MPIWFVLHSSRCEGLLQDWQETVFAPFVCDDQLEVSKMFSYI